MAIASPRLAGLARVVCATVALAEHISELHAENYGVYGVRKMWHTLARQGIDIGREQTARLMRLAGVAGKSKRPGSASGFGESRLYRAQAESVVGGKILPTCEAERALCTRLLSRMCSPAALLAGPCRIRCELRHWTCRCLTKRLRALRKRLA
ncbi:IS3 family transposase [Corynebacterium casei]|uniref:IS3 family transposase n=1 Tax=Corynebacterium casei TaxID=160386 RepID=UPI00135A9801